MKTADHSKSKFSAFSQVKLLKAMVAPNFSGPLNWKNETNFGKPDTMRGMQIWHLDLDAR